MMGASRPLSRPVAQKQSTRLISGRPRSITARDDHSRTISERNNHVKIAKALKLKNQLAGEVAQLKDLLSKQNVRSSKQKFDYDNHDVLARLRAKLDELVKECPCLDCKSKHHDAEVDAESSSRIGQPVHLSSLTPQGSRSLDSLF